MSEGKQRHGCLTAFLVTSARNAVLMLMVLSSSGCIIKHDYVWKEYPIAPSRIALHNSVREGYEIRIIKGKSNDSQIALVKAAPHHFIGTYKSLSDGIADQLAGELRKRGYAITETAGRSLEIFVDRTTYEYDLTFHYVTMEVTVKYGNDKTKLYLIQNKSPNVIGNKPTRVYNGAVALAVIEIINDPECAAYIRQ